MKGLSRCEKKRSSVSDHPRFPMSTKALLIKRLYDLKKTNRRFMDKRLHFQPIPSRAWSSWSANLREKYRQGKKEQEGHDGPVSLHWLILGNLFKT